MTVNELAAHLVEQFDGDAQVIGVAAEEDEYGIVTYRDFAMTVDNFIEMTPIHFPKALEITSPNVLYVETTW